MAKGREIKLPLPAADDLFSTQEERDEAKREFIADIPLTEISDFPDHPYKVKQDESMLELAASIREKAWSILLWCARNRKVVMKWWQDTGENSPVSLSGKRSCPVSCEI